MVGRQDKLRIAVSGAFALFMVFFAIVQLGLAGLRGANSDLLLDWLAVRAVSEDRNPYIDVVQLAGQYGVEIGDVGGSEIDEEERIHPRPPGALLLLYPLLLVPIENLQLLSLAVNGAATLAFVVLLAAATSTRVEWALLGTPLLMLSHPAISAFEFGAQSIVVAALVTGSVALTRHRDSALAGVLLGLAIALKLWPGLLLLFLVLRRRTRAAVLGIMTAVGLNYAGGKLLGIGWGSAWDGLSGASGTWVGFSGNGSLAGRMAQFGVPLGLALVFGALLIIPVLPALWNHRIDFVLAAGGAVAAALLMSPLAWDHYDLAAIPTGVLLLKRSRGRSDPVLWACLGWGLLMVGGRLARPLLAFSPAGVAGAVTFAGRALLLTALLASAIQSRKEIGEMQFDPDLSSPVPT